MSRHWSGADDPKKMVRAGYERAAAEYDAWSAGFDASPRRRYVSVLTEALTPGATVLEVGCGTGLATRELQSRYFVVGVDFSSACLALARQSAPRARYVQADMTRLGIRSRSVDAIIAFYSLIHVPREEQSAVLQQVATWLRPGGLLIATMGTHDLPVDYDENWRGVEMYWSSYDAATNVGIVRDAGLQVLRADEVAQEEDGKVVRFLWVVARLGKQVL